MAILSIQSAVAYGHVGNSAAVFPLQRLGREVWPVNTVQFSNHPGYGAHTGQPNPASLVRALIDGVAARGVLPQCEAVLVGYLGDPAMVEPALHATTLVRTANPAATVCWDPVIGDAGPGVYVRPGIPEALRDRCLPAADIITPNHFELQHLSGMSAGTLDGAKAAILALRRTMRPGATVLVTSLRTADTPPGELDTVAADDSGFHRFRTPLLTMAASGTGDIMAALFLHFWLITRSAPDALARSGNALFGLLTRTHQAQSRELLLIEAQDELVRPTAIFPATPC